MMCHGTWALTAILAVWMSVTESNLSAGSDDAVTELPNAVVDYAIADSGTLLVVRLAGESQLHIYDTAKKRLTGTLDLTTSSFAFGAGGDRIVVFNTKENRFLTYDVRTLMLLRQADVEDPIVVTHIVMGASRGDEAIVRVSGGTDALNRVALWTLGTEALTLRRSGLVAGTVHRSSDRNFMHLRTDAHLARISEWCTSHTPSGIGLYYRVEDRFGYAYDHGSVGYVVVGDDGNVYTGDGRMLDATSAGQAQGPLRLLDRIPGRSPIPGLGGRFYVTVSMDGALAVCPTGETQPICEVGRFPDWELPKSPNGQPRETGKDSTPGALEPFSDSRITLDRRIVFAPEEAGFLLFLPPSERKLVQRSFDLRAALDATGTNYLFVTSNPPPYAQASAMFEYPIRVLAKNPPVRFLLEQAPEGMTVSDDGLLRWQIPGGIEGKGRVSVRIEDAGGKSMRHAFDVSFK